MKKVGRDVKGDQVVYLKIEIPKKLNERQRKLIEELDDELAGRTKTSNPQRSSSQDANSEEKKKETDCNGNFIKDAFKKIRKGLEGSN